MRGIIIPVNYAYAHSTVVWALGNVNSGCGLSDVCIIIITGCPRGTRGCVNSDMELGYY